MQSQCIIPTLLDAFHVIKIRISERLIWDQNSIPNLKGSKTVKPSTVASPSSQMLSPKELKWHKELLSQVPPAGLTGLDQWFSPRWGLCRWSAQSKVSVEYKRKSNTISNSACSMAHFLYPVPECPEWESGVGNWRELHTHHGCGALRHPCPQTTSACDRQGGKEWQIEKSDYKTCMEGK